MLNFSDEAPRERVIDLGHNKVRIKAADPYGFWTIHYDKGQMPERLRGTFTSLQEAEKALTPYLNKKTETINDGSSQGPDGSQPTRT